MPGCEYLNGDRCSIAEAWMLEACGDVVQVTVHPAACDFCLSLPDAKRRNQVTASIVPITDCSLLKIKPSLAVQNANQGGFKVADLESRCGPGCQLHRILESYGVSSTDACQCTQLSNEMDHRGCQWCRDHIDYIVERLIQELDRRVTAESEPIDEPRGPTAQLPWWIRTGHKVPGASRLAAKRLVLLAIDRAELGEVR